MPRPEYPRPQLCRQDWMNLNGEWSFAFDDSNIGLPRNWQNTQAGTLRSGVSPFDRRIIVPFCYQSKLSGIGETTFHDVVWYARTFEYPPSGEDRLLLHFGAVDYRATVCNAPHPCLVRGGRSGRSKRRTGGRGTLFRLVPEDTLRMASWRHNYFGPPHAG